MSLKRIHVSQPNIKANHKDGGNRPVFSILESGKRVQHSHGFRVVSDTGEVLLEGIYNENKPLSCGARVWLESNFNIELVNESNL
jgi:hypothetical protein